MFSFSSLERTARTIPQNKGPTQNTRTQWGQQQIMNKQQQSHRLEQSAAYVREDNRYNILLK